MQNNMGQEEDIKDLILNPVAKFGKSILDTLYEQQQQALYTDFVINVAGQQVPCHRNVMAASCPYFENLLRASMKEACEQKLDVDNFKYEDIQNVIRACYGQKMTISYKDVRSTYETFDYYQFSFTDVFINFMIKGINPANCIGWCSFSAKFELQEVENVAWKCVHKQFSEASQHDEFLGLEFSEVIDLIWKDQELYNPDEVLQGCIWWLQVQENDGITLGMFLDHVNLSSCTLTYLVDLLDTHQHENVFDDASYSVINNVVSTKSQRNNTILVVGGRESGYNNSKACKILSLKTGTVNQLTSVPNLVSLLSVCRVPDGFAVIGHGHSTAEVMCFVYNQIENSWTELPPPCADEFSSITCVGSSLFVIGRDESVKENVHSLDLMALDKQWQQCKPIARKMQTPILASNQTCIFALRNSQSRTWGIFTPPLQVYVVSSDSWSAVYDLPREIEDTSGAVAVATSKHMFLLGGGANIALRYAVSDKQWTRLSRPLSLHSHGAAAILEDRIVLCGGLQGPTTLSDVVEYYDNLKDEWKMSDVKLPLPVWQHYISAV